MRHENERVIHQNRKISEVTIHPFFTGGPEPGKKEKDTMNYDFALLHLEGDFCFNDHISHVCLPENPNIKTGRQCIVFILNLNDGHCISRLYKC